MLDDEVLDVSIFTHDRMTHHHITFNQLKMVFPLAIKKAGMKEEEDLEEKEKKTESFPDERVIMSGEEVVADNIETEKEGGGKINKETIKQASEEDTDEESFDGNPSNTSKHGWTHYFVGTIIL